MRVLGLSGSLRRDSHNSALLRAAGDLLPGGVEFEVFDDLRAIPPFDQDLEAAEPAPAVAALRAAVRGADAVIVATPEYNSSIPGQLKNALDWASRPAGQSAFQGTPVAVIGASAGMFGAVWAQAEARRILGAMGATVLDEELPVGHAHHAVAADGALEDADLSAELQRILGDLVAAAAPDAVPAAA